MPAHLIHVRERAFAPAVLGEILGDSRRVRRELGGWALVAEVGHADLDLRRPLWMCLWSKDLVTVRAQRLEIVQGA